MSDEPIDLASERNKRLPSRPFVELPESDEPNMVLLELCGADGKLVHDRVGLAFELCTCGESEPIPALALTAKQCRALGNALVDAADKLDQGNGVGHE